MKQLSLVALVIFVITMFAVAEPLAAAAPHAEGKKGKSQHKAFSNANAVVINDNTMADPYPSTIEVAGFKKAKITDVDVTLRGFNHGYSGDVSVLLVAPNGDNAIIMGAAGTDPAASLSIKLDDEASNPLPDLAPLQSGTFQPANYGFASFPGAPIPNGDTALSTFDGGAPNGTWRLFVVDDVNGEVGAFSGGWDLKITAKAKKNKHQGHHGHNGHHGHPKKH